MNLVESSLARSMSAAESVKKETPFSGEVEVAGKSISRGDTVEIANKKGEMVKYTVTGVKPESFRVLINKVDREKAAEAEITALRETTAQKRIQKKVEDAHNIIALKTRLADIIPVEQQSLIRAYAERTGQTAALKRRGGIQTIKEDMDAHADDEKLARKVAAHDEILRLQNLRAKPITKETLRGLEFVEHTDLATVQQELDTAESVLQGEAARIARVRARIATNKTEPIDFIPQQIRISEASRLKTTTVYTNNVRPGDIQKVPSGTKPPVHEADPLLKLSKKPGVIDSATTQQHLLDQIKQIDAITQTNQSSGLIARTTSFLKKLFTRTPAPEMQSGLKMNTTTYEVPPTLPITTAVPELPDDAILSPKHRRDEDSGEYEKAA